VCSEHLNIEVNDRRSEGHGRPKVVKKGLDLRVGTIFRTKERRKGNLETDKRVKMALK
jgi:hypothetical protein